LYTRAETKEGLETDVERFGEELEKVGEDMEGEGESEVRLGESWRRSVVEIEGEDESGQKEEEGKGKEGKVEGLLIALGLRENTSWGASPLLFRWTALRVICLAWRRRGGRWVGGGRSTPKQRSLDAFPAEEEKSRAEEVELDGGCAKDFGRGECEEGMVEGEGDEPGEELEEDERSGRRERCREEGGWTGSDGEFMKGIDR
jgi:hypothetical protein